MRVLAMVHLYSPHHCAGAEMMMHALLVSLVDAGHTVDVVLSREHVRIVRPYSVDGVTVHPRVDKGDPLRWLGDPDRRPDLIVTHLENTDRASILGRVHRIPVVHVAHNTFEATKVSLLRRPALVVANSHWMAADLAAWWTAHEHDRPMPRMAVVHPPVRVADYATTAIGPMITLVNVTEAKGASLFYRIAQRLPHRQFLGVGGAYGEQDRREQQSNVTFIEHVPGHRMRDAVYARTRVLLMPSHYESWGRTGIEAACSGIPTIAHPTPGLIESLGDAGTFADRDDPDEWVRALRTLLERRTYAAASRRARARAHALDPTVELAHWVETTEAIGHASARTRGRRDRALSGDAVR
jgi:glycosyltransferase involved in cell wall biosynthesis